MESAYFIMCIVRLGINPSFDKLKGQSEDGYSSPSEAETAMNKMKKSGKNWHLKESGYYFTIMKLYW
jgi:hypothetical protein